MQFSSFLRAGLRTSVALAAALCLFAQENPTAPAKEKEAAQGLPPHVTPLEYQSRAKVGSYVIGADFHGHAVPTTIAALSNEDYVSVEVGLYGPKEAHLQIAIDDFSLRINGKKVLHSVPYGMLLPAIKDPEYEAPEAAEVKKAKSGGTSIGTGGGGQSNDPPPVIHIPIEKQRAMAQQVQKAAIPLGDRPLPQAGLIFFQYRGKTQNIESIELTYNGAAGKVTMDLRP